ncbi:hypothetical protein [Sphingomonas sp.]|jgi:hypothetical protein|uniref:hypothetical protein n=1 Tax=Sphingomonas sp. TaxID=28214 RepID=UPI00356874F4
MSVGSKNYAHPAYLARTTQNEAQNAAGASASFAKYVAFTDEKVHSVFVKTLTAGTSTHTGWNGTATVTTTGTGATIAGIKISGTTTSTYGPYVLSAAAAGFQRLEIDHTGVGSATSTNEADKYIALTTGDTFYLQMGTDATAVILPGFEKSIAPTGAISVG